MNRLLEWSREQVWWDVAQLLMEAGMVFQMHVPMDADPPGTRLHNTRTGGVMFLETCSAPVWHIVNAVNVQELHKSLSKPDEKGMSDYAAFMNRHPVGDA